MCLLVGLLFSFGCVGGFVGLGLLELLGLQCLGFD